MSVAMSYHELQANLLQLEEDIINQENGPPMAPTIVKCNCNLETCDCQECLANPLPLDGSIKKINIKLVPYSKPRSVYKLFYGSVWHHILLYVALWSLSTL
ncbi:unnamed protein product [Meganyctiphanes norvegica]|uniref:Uncharacterized protein n=1 Tax=Meganyctiphanes norvegica TaxID=48144 RepID=A0AAV2Q9E7_MEGNR